MATIIEPLLAQLAGQDQKDDDEFAVKGLLQKTTLVDPFNVSCNRNDDDNILFLLSFIY